MEEGGSNERRKQLESRALDKVGEVISAVKTAKHVDQVICALHSLAVLLFPIDSSLLAGSLDEPYQVLLSAEVPSAEQRDQMWRAFYEGAAFPTLARVLLLDVASNWLACFPFSATKHVYDTFFSNGLVTEVVQSLVPCLQYNGNDCFDVKVVRSSSERLLIVCLLENDGVLKIARHFCTSCKSEEFTTAQVPLVTRLAQIVASIPDKAQPRAQNPLSAHSFFKQITIQLLCEAQERGKNVSDKEAIFSENDYDMTGTLVFIGELFSRICRRGSTDVLLGEVTPRILGHVQSFLSSNSASTMVDVFDSDSGSLFWLKIMEAIKDPYAVERMSEELLHQLETKNATDIEAYWTLWIMFNHVIRNRPSVRSMFVEKFLLWKVFPICCLRWIIQFAILECPPVDNSLTRAHEIHGLIDTLQRLVAAWSTREFVQSAPMEQQAYVTAAIGLCIEKISREELDMSKDVMHSILRGVSSRLESPTHLVRKMASNVALAFSKVIDPKNPLYLDDSCTGDTIDWEVGLIEHQKRTPSFSKCKHTETTTLTTSELENSMNLMGNNGMCKQARGVKKTSFHSKLFDPDEIVDPATLNYESASDDKEDDDESENSDSSSDSSLQPYDLTDEDTDLKRKFTQFTDVIRALQKSDDADGVDGALTVVEKLVRASPDELTHVAGDLVRTLVQVRCSDLTIEGEEESAEEKRQRALIALLVTRPFESLDILNKLLYSPNVDVSQRIMILDVMTEAAQELADAKMKKQKHISRSLVSTISESQSWFLPCSSGPPGASPWKEISETGIPLNYSHRYERELPPKPGQIRKGKTRRWRLRSANIQENQFEWVHNKFPVYAAAFMLPAMQGFDKKRHGVDLLDRDFIVLGKLIYMLGVCIKCVSMHPEASALAPSLIDMLRTRELCHHKEAYVRRAVLFAASCVLMSLHPSFVASALTEGNIEFSMGLEWIRTWALDVAESDVDRECYSMALSCLQLHAEMALQASRALETAKSTFKAKGVGLPSNLSNMTIKLPYSNVEY